MGKDTGQTSIEQLQLLQAMIQNNEKVLRQLYRENYARVKAYVLANQGTTDEANDVYQEAFIAVWRNIQLNRFVPDNGSSLQAYLYRIAKNKWIDHLRAAKSKRTVPYPGDADFFSDPAEAAEDSQVQFIEAVKEKLETLGGRCRELLKRYYYQKQTLKQIAGELTWTEQTARNNKYRCMEKLRELIKSNR